MGRENGWYWVQWDKGGPWMPARFVNGESPWGEDALWLYAKDGDYASVPRTRQPEIIAEKIPDRN